MLEILEWRGVDANKCQQMNCDAILTCAVHLRGLRVHHTTTLCLLLHPFLSWPHLSTVNISHTRPLLYQLYSSNSSWSITAVPFRFRSSFIDLNVLSRAKHFLHLVGSFFIQYPLSLSTLTSSNEESNRVGGQCPLFLCHIGDARMANL